MRHGLRHSSTRVLATLAASALLVSCATTTTPPSSTGTAASTAAAKNTTPVKIGWSGPFTGPLQAMANTMQAGIKISAEEVNAKGGGGGRPIQPVVKDDALSPDKAVAQTQEFINNDKIEIMLGPAVNTAFLPTRGNYAKANMTQFLVGTAATGVDLKKFPYVYRTFFSGDDEAEMIIDFLYNVKKAKKIAILVENTGSGLPGAQSLQRAIDLNPNVKTVTQQVFPSGESNLTSYIQAIQKSGAEAIALWSVGGPNTANVAKAMDELKFYIPVAGDIGAVFKAVPQLAGDALNRVELYAGAWRSELYVKGSQPDKIYTDFRDKVKSLMGVSEMADSVHLAYMYYDTISVVAQALTKTEGNTSAEVLRKVLESSKFTTPLGNVYSFSPTSHDGFGRENLSIARITPASWKDGFWEKAEGAP